MPYLLLLLLAVSSASFCLLSSLTSYTVFPLKSVAPVLGRGMNYNPTSVMPNSIHGVLPTPGIGYRFHPTNEELIINYLKPKIRGDDVEDLLIIAEVNICKHEPWELPGQSVIKSDDLVWYFFCPRDFKDSNRRRSNRRTKNGYWKPTGRNVKIKARRTKKQIGTKKTLVFYEKATPKASRTNWIIHEYEYTFDSNQSNQGGYVLCKLKKKSDEKSNKGEPNHHTPSVSDFEAEPSCGMTSDFEYQNQSDTTVNSACNESELSHHVACHMEYQNSNELMPNSPTYLMTCNFKNQYSNELMSDSACDRSGSLCSVACGCEHQYSNDLLAVSACDGSGFCHSVAAGFDDQYSNGLPDASACDGSGSYHSVASGFENQYSIDPKVNSPGDNWLMAFDLEDQVSSPQLNSECGPYVEMPPKFICQSYDKSETSCLAVDFAHQVSSLQLNRECGPPVEMPLKFICQSYDKDETSCLAVDFENQNHEKESNISASDEGACNPPLMTAPSDLENRNPWEKTDMFTLEDLFVNYSTGSFSENIAADSALTEVSH